MRILHRTMMTAMLTAVLAVGVAEAQHGHSADPPDHFTAIAERLELTAAQRETLEEPFREMMAAMQELHRTHDVIARDLTDEQKTKFAQMFQDAMEGSAAKNRTGHHGEARH
ncbi:MAG: hypothetical protein E2P02_07325 [Acidobacteria bacterium]|nr:MAG: hypothetical protein E2P02_07325 [Acidobacteriota bacterium]